MVNNSTLPAIWRLPSASCSGSSGGSGSNAHACTVASSRVRGATGTTLQHTVAVGGTFRRAGFGELQFKNEADGTNYIAPDGSTPTYTANGTPDGFMIDVRTGAVTFTPTESHLARAQYDVTIILEIQQDSSQFFKRSQTAVVLTFELVVKYADSDPNNPLKCGPHGKACNADHSTVRDTTLFDGAFECECDSHYSGDNCDTPMLLIGLLTATFVGASLLVAVGVCKYKATKARRQAHDFHAELQKMLSEGEIEPEHAANNAVPREIRRSCVQLSEQIGEGQFGAVYKGTLDEFKHNGVPGYLAAIKMVSDPDAPEDAFKELYRESAVMAQISGHPNIVSLIGVVTKGFPLMLLVSYCDKGSLLSILRERAASNDPLRIPSKVQLAIHIAQGMHHLASLLFVHRDLAARNVLVDAQRIAKVADFGLSRGTNPMKARREDEQGDAASEEGQTYYRSKTGIFPVRWTAPEAMEDLKFTTASDVWSFGIVMVELFENGRTPYGGHMGNTEVINFVSRGNRIDRPIGCPHAVYTIMLSCWRSDGAARPSFATLQAQLHENLGAEKESQSLRDRANTNSDLQPSSAEFRARASSTARPEKSSYSGYTVGAGGAGGAGGGGVNDIDPLRYRPIYEPHPMQGTGASNAVSAAATGAAASPATPSTGISMQALIKGKDGYVKSGGGSTGIVSAASVPTPCGAVGGRDGYLDIVGGEDPQEGVSANGEGGRARKNTVFDRPGNPAPPADGNHKEKKGPGISRENRKPSVYLGFDAAAAAAGDSEDEETRL